VPWDVNRLSSPPSQVIGTPIPPFTGPGAPGRWATAESNFISRVQQGTNPRGKLKGIAGAVTRQARALLPSPAGSKGEVSQKYDRAHADLNLCPPITCLSIRLPPNAIKTDWHALNTFLLRRTFSASGERKKERKKEQTRTQHSETRTGFCFYSSTRSETSHPITPPSWETTRNGDLGWEWWRETTTTRAWHTIMRFCTVLSLSLFAKHFSHVWRALTIRENKKRETCCRYAPPLARSDRPHAGPH